MHPAQLRLYGSLDRLPGTGRQAHELRAHTIAVLLALLGGACDRPAQVPAGQVGAPAPPVVSRADDGLATIAVLSSAAGARRDVDPPAPPDAKSSDLASDAGLRRAFYSAVESCNSIQPWLEFAELALASLAGDAPMQSTPGRWTYRVDWPHSTDRVEVASTTGLPDDAHLVQIRVELPGALQPADCPVALDGLLEIFLRWKQDSLVECTVMTQLELPERADLDEWVERASPGARRKGAFVQCYSSAPSLRRTIEVRLERTPEGPVRASRFVDAPGCDCSTSSGASEALRNLCRAVRQSHH